jgi:uncharacterized protein (TIGR02246 family)
MKLQTIILLLASILSAHASAEQDIRSVLDLQVAAWNKGNLEEFVETYADDATFVGSKSIRGRDALLRRYRERYPSRDAMGTLTFSDLEIRLLDSTVAVVVGQFHLKRSKEGGGDTNGLFSLVLRHEPGGWKIVLDHTG